jgi:hypothetical protein
MLAGFLDKCSFQAFGTDDIERSSATLADCVSLAYLMEAGRAAIDKRAHAAAFRTEMGIPGEKVPAMDAWLFIECHGITSLSTITIL